MSDPRIEAFTLEVLRAADEEEAHAPARADATEEAEEIHERQMLRIAPMISAYREEIATEIRRQVLTFYGRREGEIATAVEQARREGFEDGQLSAGTQIAQDAFERGTREAWERAEVNPNADALVGGCARCGQRVPFDYTVDDAFWQRYVTTRDWRLGVLCLPCLDEVASDSGGNVLEHLRVVYFSGRSGTVPLVSMRALIPPGEPEGKEEAGR